MGKPKAFAVIVVVIALFATVSTHAPTFADAYLLSECKDESGRIGYYFKNGTPDIAGTGEQQAVFTAMNLWEAVSKVEFGPYQLVKETEISWEIGAHGDVEDFDGPNGIAGHAFYSCFGGSGLNGDIHFDEAEEWIDANEAFFQPKDLVRVATHELGHALGLEHSQDSSAIMAKESFPRRALGWDDIFGVQLLYGRSLGVYHLKNAVGAGNPSKSFEYALINNAYRPVAGDWNGDGIDTIGVWSGASGNFTLHNGNPGGTKYEYGYGKAGDLPVVGDWDGDGDTTGGIYRSSNTSFYLENTHTSSSSEWFFSFGKAGDIPVGGDWNGDGIDSAGVFRPSESTFYLRNEKSAGPADATIGFGESGDMPVVGDWDNDGDDTIGIYRPSTGLFYLRNTNSAGAADHTLNFGRNMLGQVVTPVRPVAGDWDGDGTVGFGLYQN